MRQPKVGSRLSAYSATSQNTIKGISKSNSEHKLIVKIGWRVVAIVFTLNCMHMQAVVHVIQAVAKTAPLQQQWIIMSALGRMQC